MFARICASVFLLLVAGTQAGVAEPTSLFDQLVGDWTNTGGPSDRSGSTIRVVRNGDVWTSNHGLARVSSTIDSGGNFAFEGASGGQPYRCVYYITFLSDRNKTNWKKVREAGAVACAEGVFERAMLDPVDSPVRTPTRPETATPRPSTPSGRPGSKPQTSRWFHNGSTLVLLLNRDRRLFFYDQPKSLMLKAGARRGDLLFDGIRNGQLYSGTAYIFRRHCGKFPYKVAGSLNNQLTRITMTGTAPRVDVSTCQITGERLDELVFDLLPDTN